MYKSFKHQLVKLLISIFVMMFIVSLYCNTRDRYYMEKESTYESHSSYTHFNENGKLEEENSEITTENGIVNKESALTLTRE